MDEEERSIITSLGLEVEWLVAAVGGGDRVGWRMGGEMEEFQLHWSWR